MLRLLRPGDHLVIPDDAYGGTYRLVSSIYAACGVGFSPVELQTPTRSIDAWREQTRLVWLETPSNPKLNIIDIEAVAAIAHAQAPSASSTTPSRRPTCNSRSLWGPMPSCIPRPSTWVGTPTS